MIKNIFLDLDDTILDFKKAEKHALTRTFHQLGLNPAEKILQRYSHINQEQWKLLEQGRLTRPQISLRRFQLLFEETNISCDPEIARRIYEAELAKGHFFIQGAEELLKCISEKYDLYLASNGSATVQNSRIASADIGKYFKEIFISEQIGYNKPSIHFYNQCFSQISGFIKSEAIMIGDSLSSDILGGKNAGIHTMWYNPSHSICAADIAPDFIVDDLKNIPDVLQKIR